MQPSTNGHFDKKHLQFLRQKIEHELQWGTGDNWRHQDFSNLSEKILAKTSKQLSSTTLKRIWGKLEYNNLPTSHTLNTLAQFVDYENWLVFKASIDQTTSRTGVSLPKSSNKFSFLFSNPLFKIIGGIGLCLLLITGIISLMPVDANKSLHPTTLETIQFSGSPVTVGVPNTVIFKYDVSHINADSFQIQQNWDKRRRFLIQKDQNEVTSTYYYPGHWRAKLLVNEQVVKEQDLYIKSNGWVATINYDPIPRYLKNAELITAGYLGVAEKVQTEIEARTEPPETMTFHYIDEFENLHSDNFTLELSFKNTWSKGNGICQFSRIAIDGTEGIFLIPFSILGCVGDLSMRFSEVVQKGSQHDFSKFACDFTDWQHFRLRVKNRNATLFLNEQLIHEIQYTKSAGKIAGLNIRFVGLGAIDDVTLINGKEVTIFEEDFGGEGVRLGIVQ